MTGRILHAKLHLLDRQVLEHGSETLLCKVDDVDLYLDAAVPVVTALLTGPQALGPRVRGRLGRWIQAVHRRLHPDPDPAPVRIPMGRVLEIGSAIKVDPRGIEVEGFGQWVEHHIIERIPGATDAPQ